MSREMKNSGIEWIGQIPQHWIALPNKYLMKKLKMILSRYNDEPILSLTMDGVIVRDLDAGGKMPTSFDGYQKISKGNLLMCLFDIDVTPRCIGLIKQDGVTSPAYSQFVLNAGNYAPYYYYLYLYLDNDKLLLPLAKNLRHSLTEDVLGEIPMIQPPLSEQQSIANYLDFKCSQIDRLSDNIKQQIEELGEYKKALITQAVTKGLDPDVEMKDSGIAWVGNMPKEWETVPAKSMFMQRNDKGNKYVLQLLSPTQKFGVIPQSLYEEKTGQNAVKLDEKTNLSALKTVHKGDYCISLRSFQGGFELSDYEGVVSPAYQVFYPIKAVGQRYYKYLFKTQRFINEMNSYTMSLRDGKNIAFADFGKSYIPVPPLSEQKRIGNYLDLKCSQIDALIQTKSKTLNVLQEYKKSLILDYVTGKKEVPDSYRKDGCHE